MAIMMFLFGSALGLTGAVAQLVLGFDLSTAFQTYVFVALGLPLSTLLAFSSRASRKEDQDSSVS